MDKSFLFPLIYCLAAGISWSLLFQKRFYESLAPSLFLQILIVTFSAVAHLTLSTGLGISIAAIILMLVAGIIRNLGKPSPFHFLKGISLFLIFFLLVWYIDEGKRFTYFDEFQQWGMFLKECLRTDHLYAESSLNIQHRDYVPAITVFEVIWARLSGRYQEMDAYRSLQILCFAMILPVFRNILASFQKKNSAGTNVLNLLVLILAYAAVLVVPVIFNTADGFLFYHTLYLDYLQGLLVFYCIHTAIQKNESSFYTLFSLSLSLSVLVLSKQTSIAFLPMVVLFYAVCSGLFSSDHHLKFGLLGLTSAVLPSVLWLIYRSYSDSYVSYQSESALLQTYDHFTLSSLIQLLQGKRMTGVQIQIKTQYLDALKHTSILLKGSYLQVLLILIIMMVLIAFCSKGIKRKKVFLCTLWTAAAGSVYAFLMYFLYQTAFDPEEASALASYSRYMNVFLVTAVYLLLDLFFFSEIWKKYHRIPCLLMLASFLTFLGTKPELFAQMKPGTLTNDEETADQYENFADLINKNTEEDSSILIVTRASMPYMNLRLNYYCMPRKVRNISPGPAISAQDTFSEEMSIEEFVSLVSENQYLFLNLLDQDFASAYASAFEDPSEIVSATIFKAEIKNGKIALLPTEKRQ